MRQKFDTYLVNIFISHLELPYQSCYIRNGYSNRLLGNFFVWTCNKFIMGPSWCFSLYYFTLTIRYLIKYPISKSYKIIYTSRRLRERKSVTSRFLECQKYFLGLNEQVRHFHWELFGEFDSLTFGAFGGGICKGRGLRS